MHPILFEIGNWPVYSYGVLLAAAYLSGLQLAVVRARHRGLDGARVMDLGIYLIIAALVGAKLMLVAVDFDYFRSQPREMLSLVRAGGVFYGGLILSTIVGLMLVRRYKLPAWTVADVYAPGIALGHVIGLPIVTPALAEAARLAEELGGAAKPSGAGGGDVGIAFLTDRGAAETFRQRAPHIGLEILSIRTGASGLRREPSARERNHVER